MQDIEPFFKWRDDYVASEDERSPLFQTVYNEFYYDKQIYNYCIHPQWDSFGSGTLYLKVLYVDYEKGFTIIEFIGEWNDAIGNDIMLLKREIIEKMLEEGIVKFILIGENVLAFHSSDDCYYEEWYQEVEDGWIVAVNFLPHVLEDMTQAGLDYYLNFGGVLNDLSWREMNPNHLFKSVQQVLQKRLE